MKLDIIIVDLVLVAAVFLPYFLFVLIGRKEQNKLKSKFFEETENYQLHFNEVDKWNNNLLGLDKEKSMILLVQKRKTDFSTILVDLKPVRSCEVFQEVGSSRRNKRVENVLQSVCLKLNLYGGTTQIVNLYNCDETYCEDYELKHAEKWQRVINEIVAMRPTINSAA